LHTIEFTREANKRRVALGANLFKNTRGSAIDRFILLGIKRQQGGELCIKGWIARVKA